MDYPINIIVVVLVMMGVVSVKGVVLVTGVGVDFVTGGAVESVTGIGVDSVTGSVLIRLRGCAPITNRNLVILSKMSFWEIRVHRNFLFIIYSMFCCFLLGNPVSWPVLCKKKIT